MTAEEIRNSGARDLIDVLRNIPGFTFGVDQLNVTGIAFRGNWVHEGKLLLLIDGQEMNEISYATLPVGYHFPVDHIERIEVLRGPGSSIYGGYAELAVINIITKSAKDLQGLEVNGCYGTFGSDASKVGGSLSFGKVIDDFSLVAHLFYGKAGRSAEDYTDFYEGSFNMIDENTMHPFFTNIGIGYKGLFTRVIIDRYHLMQRDMYDEIADKSYKVTFDTYIYDLKWDLELSKNITITPRINYKTQQTWILPGFDEDLSTMERFIESIIVSWDITNRINLIAGQEVYWDRATNEADVTYNYNYIDEDDRGERRVRHNNIAGFFQGLFNTPYANLTVGARYDYHSEYGYALSPRIALTRVFDDLHIKLLYSRAFRAASPDNIYYFTGEYSNQDKIKPERTSVIEAEAGFLFTKKMSFQLNLFDIRIDDTIVYYFHEQDAYDNFDKTGTTGGEAELRYQDRWGYIVLNYSLAMTNILGNDNEVSLYYTQDRPEQDGDIKNDKVMLGMPMHHASLNTSINFWKNLSLNPSAKYIGKRWGYYAVEEYLDDEDGEYCEDLLIKEFDQVVLINCFISYENLFIKGLDLGLGVNNILDEEYVFIQPYRDGWHAPMPGSNRDYFMHVSYIYEL